MKITVFGASGGIGAQVVDLAGPRGHSVRAVYRAAPHVPVNDQAEILVGPDIFDPRFAAQAIHGADVVVAAVGPNFARRHNPRTKMISPPDLHQRLARTLCGEATIAIPQLGQNPAAMTCLWQCEQTASERPRSLPSSSRA